MRQRYVLGFILSDDGSLAALLRKKRPAWQADKLNGIGGHVEYNEDFLTAMNRESLEEVGRSFVWESVATLITKDWEMLVYATRIPLVEVVSVQCIEDEVIER